MIDWESGRLSIDWDGLSGAAQIPLARRIYVNRNLRMAGIKAIGFDMDHTLALYDPVPFEELAFEETKGKLLDAGYPEELRAARYNPRFAIRGLVVDKRRGNILKMDQHRYVAKVWHGLAPIPYEERKRLYQRSAIQLGNGDFVAIDTPFSLPEIALYAVTVDIADGLKRPAKAASRITSRRTAAGTARGLSTDLRKRAGRRPDYYRIYEEVRAAMDQAHADGSIKSRIALDPDRYLVRDPALPATLDRMKKHGYRLFLLTNSEADYTALIMDRLLSRQLPSRPHWTDFFDVIVVRAGKPRFFQDRAQAKPIILPGAPSSDAGPSQEKPQRPGGARPRRPMPGKAFTGGGVADLEKRLGCAGDQILYFGDHTYGDILKSKRVRFWRTAMVVQELEREIATLERCCESLAEVRRLVDRREELEFISDFLDRAPEGHAVLPQGLTRRQARSASGAITQEIDRLDARVAGLEDQCEREHNPHWGPLFRTGRELSHFAAQVRGFACIYTSRVSNFLRYPMDRYFQVHPDRMPHEDPDRA